MKKKIIAITILSLALINATNNSFGSTSINDMSEHWAKENVEKLAGIGIIAGYEDGTFKPENTVTYAEFIKMLVVGFTGEDVGVSDGTHWASDYYKSAVENNLLRKEDIPEYYLIKQIPRADMAYLASKAVDEILTKEKENAVRNYIADLSKAGNRKDEIVFAYGTGILAGYPDGNFKPSGYLTRAESAAVISRIIDPSMRLEINFEIIEGEIPPLTEDTPLLDYALTIPDSAKKPISDIEGFNGTATRTVKYYAIVNNSSYNFILTENLVGEAGIGLDEDLAKYFNMILIKDNKLIHYTQTVNYQGIEQFSILKHDDKQLPDFDYLGMLLTGEYNYDTMILIPNPFK